MMRSIILFLVLASVGFSACETTNPFNQGPAYDFEGNLATDRKKIAAYLDTAKIDSVYRIHDPSGVVVIVQEEGKGSRPTNNTKATIIIPSPYGYSNQKNNDKIPENSVLIFQVDFLGID